MKLVGSMALAATLAACSAGGGGSVTPASGTQAGTTAADTTGTLTTLSLVTAQDNETGAIVHIHPTVDQIQTIDRQAEKTTGTVNLAYYGGAVQTAPKVYVVFWGSSWQSSSGDPNGVAVRLSAFLAAVGGKGWLNTVAQYHQQDGKAVGNAGNIYGGAYNDTASNPPSRPTYSQIAAEAQRAQAHFGDTSTNANYIVALPHGIVPSGFKTQYCAWHGALGASGFTNLPYIPDAGFSCGANSVNGGSVGLLDGVTIVGGHEQAETETDPLLNAWYDASGNEIGDKCAWKNLTNNVAAGGYPTQSLWSNAISGCASSS